MGGVCARSAELMCTVLKKKMGNSGWCYHKSCIGADTCQVAKGGCTSPQQAGRARSWFHVRWNRVLNCKRFNRGCVHGIVAVARAKIPSTSVCARASVERMVKVEKTDVRIWADLNACVSPGGITQRASRMKKTKAHTNTCTGIQSSCTSKRKLGQNPWQIELRYLWVQEMTFSEEFNTRRVPGYSNIGYHLTKGGPLFEMENWEK